VLLLKRLQENSVIKIQLPLLSLGLQPIQGVKSFNLVLMQKKWLITALKWI